MMSSKKKERRKAYLIRQEKRKLRERDKKKFQKTIKNGTIEEVAEAMNIKLN